MKNRILGLIVVGLLAAPISGFATPVTYDFTVNGGPVGPLAGVTSSGYFTYDDSIIPAGGGSLLQAGLFSDLAFSWNGISYDETTANTGMLTFDSGGVLVPMFFFGNNCAFGPCGVHDGTNQWYFQVADEGVFFEYGVPGLVGIQTGSGTVTRRTSSVPELPTGALLGIALIGIVIVRHRNFAPVR